VTCICFNNVARGKLLVEISGLLLLLLQYCLYFCFLDCFRWTWRWK